MLIRMIKTEAILLGLRPFAVARNPIPGEPFGSPRICFLTSAPAGSRQENCHRKKSPSGEKSLRQKIGAQHIRTISQIRFPLIPNQPNLFPSNLYAWEWLFIEVASDSFFKPWLVFLRSIFAEWVMCPKGDVLSAGGRYELAHIRPPAEKTSGTTVPITHRGFLSYYGNGT